MSMSAPETRRGRRKKERFRQNLERGGKGLLALTLAGILTLSGTAIASASEEVVDDTVATTTAPTETTVDEGAAAEDDSAPAEQPDAATPESEPVTTPDETTVDEPEPAEPAEQPEPEQAAPTQQSPPVESSPSVSTQRVAPQQQNAPVNYGTIGTLQPSSSDANKASYWVTRIPNAIECYKYEGAAMQNNAHAYLTNDGKTVILKPYGADWPGDHWAALIVKASTWDAVTLTPSAGVPYAAYDNKEISHYIVCKGETPEQPPTDACKNIDGNQDTVPDGYIGVGEKCYLIQTRLEKGEWEEGAPDCTAGTVTSTRTIWTVTFYVKNGEEVEISRTSEEKTKTRDLTEEEIESCKPEIPEPKVTYTEWADEEWVCGDENVTQNRTKTTTPYKAVYVDGAWKIVEDTENAVTVTETQTRPLTEEEIESCKPEIPEPKVEYTEWVDGEWVCGDTEVTQERAKTTTPYKAILVSGSTWEIVEDTENITALLEDQTRPLTDEELATCPVTEPPTEEPPVTTPPDTKPPAPVVPTTNTVRPGATGDIAAGNTAALSFTLMGLLAAAVAATTVIMVRRRPAGDKQ